jgi:hypothetical protein
MSSSHLFPVDPRLRGFGAAAEHEDSINLIAEPASSTEPSSSAVRQDTSAEPVAEPFAEPSALPASETLERVQPKAPGLNYTSKALYVDSLAGYYGVFPPGPTVLPQFFV